MSYRNIVLTPRIHLQQVSNRRWRIVVDGRIVLDTFGGEKSMRAKATAFVPK